jgi:hypothetical protein
VYRPAIALLGDLGLGRTKRDATLFNGTIVHSEAARIDGEAVITGDDRMSDFRALRKAARAKMARFYCTREPIPSTLTWINIACGLCAAVLC